MLSYFNELLFYVFLYIYLEAKQLGPSLRICKELMHCKAFIKCRQKVVVYHLFPANRGSMKSSYQTIMIFFSIMYNMQTHILDTENQQSQKNLY